MNALLIHGNLNQNTFANAIVAANEKSKALFDAGLTDIFMLHSTGSQTALSQTNEWIEHLQKHQIQPEAFTQKLLEIDSEEPSILRFVQFIELILKGMPEKANLIVDITNGTTVQKNLLSIVCYLLDLPHQYMIDIIKLREHGEIKGFIAAEILSECYVPVPESSILDQIAYLNLAEVLRYKKLINDHKPDYVATNPEKADESFFQENLERSIQLQLAADQNLKEPAIYRISSSALSATLEDLIRILVDRTFPLGDSSREDKLPFGDKIKRIEHKVLDVAPPDFDFKFLNLFNDFILHIRNTTTHKSKKLSILEKIKAELSRRMAFPFIEYYTRVVAPILEKTPGRPSAPNAEAKSDSIYYFGLDGDFTGSFLENLFLSDESDEKFSELSQSVKVAINTVASKIKKEFGKQAVIFAAGDDILFKGPLDKKFLNEIKEIYANETNGLTCSIGVGKSLREVYLALKLAKSKPGKNNIVKI